MFPLVLFWCALAGAVLAAAYIRLLLSQRRPRVPTEWIAAIAMPAEPGQGVGDWENEGGSLAVRSRRGSVRRG
jgi:hypothetical protein